MITREVEDFPTKQEGITTTSGNNSRIVVTRPPSSSTTTTTTSSWSRLKDPRIVRVSRAFRGKDRHSKVCTVRGLRDRRVRLSVPTAIQLYDLQDRLGLNQPSKVVDWLLNAARYEIDELPPLQIPPGALDFPHNLHPMLIGAAAAAADASHQLSGDKEVVFGHQHRSSIITDSAEEEEATLLMRASNKSSRETITGGEKSRSEGLHQQHGAYAAADNDNPSSSLSLVGLMSNSMPYNPFLRWDPSNLSLSHHHQQPSEVVADHFHNFNIVNNMPSGSSQVVLCPQPHYGLAAAHHQSYFSSNNIDLQMLNSSNCLSPQPVDDSSSSHRHHHHDQQQQQPVRPFHFSMMANLLPKNNHCGSEPNKDSGDYDNNSR